MVAATWFASFQPPELEVHVGNVIRWQHPLKSGEDWDWHDVVFTHAGVLDRYRFFNSDKDDDWDNWVDDDNNYTLQAKTVGTYPYFCSLHEGMGGVLHVRPVNETLRNSPVVEILEMTTRRDDAPLRGVGIGFHPGNLSTNLSYSIDGSDLEPVSGSALRWELVSDLSSLAAGPHEVRVRIEAQDGTHDEDSMQFQVGPRTRLEISSPPNAAKVSGHFTVEGRAWDPDGNMLTVEGQVANGTWNRLDVDDFSEWSFEVDAATLPEGPLQISVRANQVHGLLFTAIVVHVQD